MAVAIVATIFVVIGFYFVRGFIDVVRESITYNRKDK